MAYEQDGRQIYLCPMHPQIRHTSPGKCPKCGMDLLPEGTRFGMLRHMIKNPTMLAFMVAVMAAFMAIAMIIIMR